MSTPFAALTVPLDASDQAAHAVDYAVALARGGKTALHFCSVVDPAAIASPGAMGAMVDPTPLLDALEANARQVTAAAVDEARAAGVSADAAVLFGGAATAIAQSARETGSDGIVICTHARTGFVRFISGSVTEAVLSLTTVPLIVVHHDDDAPRNGPITVAIDGSPSSDAALETAIALAVADGRSLALMHVVPSGEQWPDAAPILAAAADRVRATKLDFELVTLRGDAASTIVESAQRRGSPLVVMGTHGRSGVGRAILGSVAAAVIERARMPVVVVRKP
ncbi:MAG: universal stress protein [Candidatus Lustribacter sp.]|jgi:nucleotide-binding universal stress UspA family protein